MKRELAFAFGKAGLSQMKMKRLRGGVLHG